MLKAIETYYKGYRFRSRLEARWAVFFDSLKIKWQYEPEGLILSDGTYYLPDFYLPDCKTFFEVKGLLTDKDMRKIEQLIQAGYCVAIGLAAADDEAGLTFMACNHWGEEDGRQIYALTKEMSSCFCKCHACGSYFFTGYDGMWDCPGCGNQDGEHDLDFLMDGDGAIIPDGCTIKDNYGTIEMRYRDPKMLVRSAVTRFKQARFEHGEVPA